MKKIFISAFAVFFTSMALLSAQIVTEDETFKYPNTSALDARNGVGASYFSPNNFSGDAFLGGLCYQHWFTERIGSEFGGSVFWSPSESYLDPLSYNIYGEFDFVLYQSEPSKFFASRLFTWGLLGHTGDIDSVYNDGVSGEGAYVAGPFTPDFRLGIGFGFDLIFFKHISIPIKFGFTGSLSGAGFTFGGGIKYIW